MASAARSGWRKLTVFVGNLPWTVSHKELGDYFSKFGSIKKANVVFNKKTMVSRGYGFVTFDNPEVYRTVIQQHDLALNKSKLLIRPASST